LGRSDVGDVEEMEIEESQERDGARCNMTFGQSYEIVGVEKSSAKRRGDRSSGRSI
jgi:hypothetical protein